MAVPDFQTLMRPLLVIVEDGEQHNIATVRELLADQFELTADDREERIPSGRVTTLQNRVGWAATYLYRCGLLDRPRRAHYRITDRGREVLRTNADRVDLSVLRQFPEFAEFRSRGESRIETTPTTTTEGEDAATPEERMENAHTELRSALAAELIERVRDQHWRFFEDLVLDVLRAMGYGGRGGEVEHLGRSGDGGVDGVIHEDALGLDSIYVQAKSQQGGVGRPALQRFVGALDGRSASKGVFITTTSFSQEAIDYAESATPRIVLIDGTTLAELMIDHGVGVTVQHEYEVKRVDLDYFVSDDADAAGNGGTN